MESNGLFTQLQVVQRSSKALKEVSNSKNCTNSCHEVNSRNQSSGSRVCQRPRMCGLLSLDNLHSFLSVPFPQYHNFSRQFLRQHSPQQQQQQTQQQTHAAGRLQSTSLLGAAPFRGDTQRFHCTASDHGGANDQMARVSLTESNAGLAVSSSNQLDVAISLALAKGFSAPKSFLEELQALELHKPKRRQLEPLVEHQCESRHTKVGNHRVDNKTKPNRSSHPKYPSDRPTHQAKRDAAVEQQQQLKPNARVGHQQWHSPRRQKRLLRRYLVATQNHHQQATQQIHNDIHWIQTHFPVADYITKNCSRALRLENLVHRLVHSVAKSEQEWGFLTWQQQIREQKRLEQVKYQACEQIEHAAENQVLRELHYCFALWKSDVLEHQQAMELEAAAATIQNGFHYWQMLKRKRELRAHEHLLAKCVLQIHHRHHRGAIRIQSFWRGILPRRRFIHFKRLVVRVQLSFRTRQNRRKRHLERQRRLLWRLFAVCESHQFEFAWLQWKFWVDQSREHDLRRMASSRIQSLARGFLVRKNLRKQIHSASIIQRGWRRFKYLQMRHVKWLKRKLSNHHLMNCVRATCLLDGACRRFQRRRTASHFLSHQVYEPVAVQHHQLQQRQQQQEERMQAQAAVVLGRSFRHFHSQQTQKRILQDREQLNASGKISKWVFEWRMVRKWHGTVHITTQLSRLHRRHSAVVIQKGFRAWFEYQKLQQQLAASLLALQTRETRAANLIQRFVKSFLLRQRHIHKAQMNAAQRIQRQWSRFRRHQAFYERKRHEAACKIQRLWLSLKRKREARVFRMRYKILFARELRQRQQREVIHKFLKEQQDKRHRRQHLREFQAKQIAKQLAEARARAAAEEEKLRTDPSAGEATPKDDAMVPGRRRKHGAAELSISAQDALEKAAKDKKAKDSKAQKHANTSGSSAVATTMTSDSHDATAQTNGTLEEAAAATQSVYDQQSDGVDGSAALSNAATDSSLWQQTAASGYDGYPVDYAGYNYGTAAASYNYVDPYAPQASSSAQDATGGWVQCWSDEYQAYYWYHPATNTSQW